MPVIRYRTRDLTRLLPGTALAPHRRMELDVVAPGVVERSQGKAKRIDDRRS